MTVKVSRPSIDIRGTLDELNFAKVPYQKMPAGSVVQVEQSVIQNKLTIANVTAKWGEVTINTKAPNSKFLIEVHVGIGLAPNDGNHDVDLAVAVGWKEGLVDSSSQNYNTVSSSSFTREVIAGLSNWLAWDAYSSAGIYEGYIVRNYSYSKIFSPNLAAGTDLVVAQFVQSENGTFTFGASQIGAYSDAGFEQTITITEVAQ